MKRVKRMKRRENKKTSEPPKCTSISFEERCLVTYDKLMILTGEQTITKKRKRTRQTNDNEFELLFRKLTHNFATRLYECTLECPHYIDLFKLLHYEEKGREILLS